MKVVALGVGGGEREKELGWELKEQDFSVSIKRNTTFWVALYVFLSLLRRVYHTVFSNN